AGPPVAAPRLADNASTGASGDLRRPVRRVAVDHYDLGNLGGGNVGKDEAYGCGLVVGRDDDRDTHRGLTREGRLDGDVRARHRCRAGDREYRVRGTPRPPSGRGAPRSTPFPTPTPRGS